MQLKPSIRNVAILYGLLKYLYSKVIAFIEKTSFNLSQISLLTHLQPLRLLHFNIYVLIDNRT